MSSFRAATRGYRSGELSAKDLTNTIHSLSPDLDQGSLIVNGLVALLDDEEKRTDVLTAWNALRIERTQFPSLMSGTTASGSAGSRYANAAQGSVQIRNIKNTSSGSNKVLESVERAASSAGGAYAARAGRQGFTGASTAFPALSKAKGPNGTIVPGSASHALAKRQMASSAAAGTPWSSGATSSSTANRMPARPTAVSTAPSSYATKTNGVLSVPGSGKGKPVNLTGTSFPGLPSSASAAALAQKKKQLLAKSSGQGRSPAGLSSSVAGSMSGGSSPNASGANTPNPWGGREPSNAFDGGSFDVDDAVYEDAFLNPSGAGASGQGVPGKKKKRGTTLITLGAVQRG
jgi:E3 ubiquitin-protein ligase ZNF598